MIELVLSYSMRCDSEVILNRSSGVRGAEEVAGDENLAWSELIDK